MIKMSTANSNLDNDPFPVFTPRSTLNTILQGRSPLPTMQQSQQPSGIIQQSPYQNNSTTRFTTNQSMLRSPNTSTTHIRHDPNNVQLLQNRIIQNIPNSPNYVLPSMVQNLTLNPTHTPLPNVQNMKLQSTSSSASLSSTVPTTTTTHAHRKLFPLDVQTTLSHQQLTSTVANNTNLLNDNNNLNEVHQQQQDYEQNNGRTVPPDMSNIYNLKRSDSFFMSDELRNEILKKNLSVLTPANPDIVASLPQQLKDYHSLVPLDSQQLNIDHKSRTFNYQTISYKATHIKTNCVYYLKIIIGFRLTNQRHVELVEIWKKIQHANIVSLRDVFCTKEFNGEHAIVFVYDYYPASETLQQRFYQNQNFNLKGWANPFNVDGSARPYSAGKGKIGLSSSRALGLLPEQIIWDYIIQLTSIIRTIHSANLACRILTPSRILMDHKSRLRLSGCGIFDVIDYENTIKNVVNYQQEDLMDFGRLVIALACNSLFAIQKEHFNTSMDIISRNYSTDLRNLIIHFISPNMMNNRIKSINDAMPIIGARFYTCLDNAFTRGDVIENELSKEVENSRLFRLICKLNIILDRQDCGDSAWNETGDRYMLKLFRDYVFHQLNSNGSPWIDLSHIVQCLNKFDYGSPERISLISPDGQSIMIVTYAQLKKCFEKVFNELTSTNI